MKNLILTALLIVGLGFTNASAQTSHKEAKKMLADASARLNSFKNIFLKFTYTFENTKVEPPVKQSEDGDIAIKGDDFHLNFLGTTQIKVKKQALYRS